MNTIIIAVVSCIIIIGGYSTYASVIKKKNKVSEAFSGVDVQLKKRYDLIPNILTLANKFMEHEKSLFAEVTKLRTKALSIPDGERNIDRKIQLDSKIKDLMGQIMVSIENYPQLKSDQTMITAMQTYNEVEEHIAAARRFYNSAVLELNNAVEVFPSSIFAAMLGIKKREFFKADEEARKPIKA